MAYRTFLQKALTAKRGNFFLRKKKFPARTVEEKTFPADIGDYKDDKEWRQFGIFSRK